MLINQIDYPKDSAQLFEHFAGLPYAIFLDSCHPHYKASRFDILTAEPFATLTSENGISTLQEGNKITRSEKDPFMLVKEYLKNLRQDLADDLTQDLEQAFQISDLPFTIGALGYFGYDLGRQLEVIPEISLKDCSLPDAVIGFYDWSIVVDHQNQLAYLITKNQEKYVAIQSLLSKTISQKNDFQTTTPFTANMTKEEYQQSFLTLQEHILEGNCYEANFCQRFTAEYKGSPWAAYQKLREINPAPFATYFNFPQGTLLSLSPERFLQLHNGVAESKPIKGTRPRSPDSKTDIANAEILKNSEKDKAENLMIVDLLRNDFGKCCVPGSIKVPELFALESFKNVHHLVSTVTGKLEKDHHALDLLKHCFPGGSITGAPKISAMKIIESLEPHRRSAYCGTIGYFDIAGNMDCNILIRSLLCCDNKVHCYAGGAIVSDSECDAEYQETWDKVGNLLTALSDM